jgi:hypothetical protein
MKLSIMAFCKNTLSKMTFSITINYMRLNIITLSIMAEHLPGKNALAFFFLNITNGEKKV